MSVSVYTTDPALKRRFCRDARTASESWKQMKWFMRLNNLSLAASGLLLVHTVVRTHAHVILAGILVLFFSILGFMFLGLANMDVYELFMTRTDETIAFLENGDMIYSYRTTNAANKSQSTVVLKMKNSDTRDVAQIDHPMKIMIFTGAFSRTVSTGENVISALVAAVNSKDAAEMEGSIIFPWYITLNRSLTDTLKKQIAS